MSADEDSPILSKHPHTVSPFPLRSRSVGGVGVWSVQLVQVRLVGCGQHEPRVWGEVGRGGLRPCGQVGALLLQLKLQKNSSWPAHVALGMNDECFACHPLFLLCPHQSAAMWLRSEPFVPHEALPPPPRPQGNVDRVNLQLVHITIHSDSLFVCVMSQGAGGIGAHVKQHMYICH